VLQKSVGAAAQSLKLMLLQQAKNEKAHVSNGHSKGAQQIEGQLFGWHLSSGWVFR